MYKKPCIRYALIVAVITIGLLFLSMSNTTGTVALASDPVPVYQIPIDDSLQAYIWELCQDHDLSFELLLSIYMTEDSKALVREAVKSDIIELASQRNAWTQEGYSDEIAYDMLLDFRWNATKTENGFLVENYVETVTEYKSYLEQRLDNTN